MTAVVSFPLESGSEGLELMYSWPKSVETEGPLQYVFRVGRDMHGMRDVENIYRDQYGTPRKFGSGCGIEEPYWENAKQALIYSLIFLTKQTTD